MSSQPPPPPPGPYPPQGGQPYYGQPPKKKGRVLLWVVLGVILGFFLLCGGCLAVVAGMDTASDESAKDNSSETKKSDKSRDGAKPTEEATEEEEPEPEPKWETVATLEGNTAKAGPDFHLNGCETRLKYDIQGSGPIVVGIYVEESGTDLMEDGGFPVAAPTEAGSDVTVLREDEGDYFIEVQAANADWSVQVQERC